MIGIIKYPKLTSILFSKINNIKKVLKNKKNLITLFFSGILIFTNWAVWIYAISTDRVIDASFGYFICSHKDPLNR